MPAKKDTPAIPVSTHTFPSEPMLRVGFSEKGNIKDLSATVSRAKEEDRIVRLESIKVNDDLSVRVDGDTLAPQAGFLRLLSRLVGYPVKNLSSMLPVDRVAGDINTLLAQKEGGAQEKTDVLVRTQKGDLFGLWPTNGRAPHLPPTSEQILEFVSQQAEWLAGQELSNDLILSGELHSGVLSVSMLMRGKDVTGLGSDPSYAGLMSSFDLRDRPGMQSGFHLMRIACTNSSVMHVGNGWSHATEDLDLTLDRFARTMARSMSYLPLLPKVYRAMVDRRITTEKTFLEVSRPVRQILGPISGEVLGKFTKLDDDSGQRFFDAKLAKKNERTNLYAMFNDLTYFAREGKHGGGVERKAQRAAGKIFEKVFEPIRRDFVEAQAA